MTLKELAEKLHISTSTISRVLNDKPGISETTRKLVLDAVKETGFSMNYAARTLAASTPGFIGIIGRKRGGQQDSLYFHHSMAQFEDYFENREYQCINLAVKEEEMDQILNGNPLNVTDFAGFIVRGQSFPAKTILSLKKRGIPIVLLENRLQSTQFDHVICEDRAAAYKLTKHLQSKGYKKIYHITGPEEWYNNKERLQGYKDAMLEADMEQYILTCSDTTVDTGMEAFGKVGRGVGSSVGYMMGNDAMAIGFADAARKSGLSIPEDIGITGFDDIPWARLAYPPLTTAKVPIEEMGKLAAGRLLQLIENPESCPVSIQVPVEIIVREST